MTWLYSYGIRGTTRNRYYILQTTHSIAGTMCFMVNFCVPISEQKILPILSCLAQGFLPSSQPFSLICIDFGNHTFLLAFVLATPSILYTEFPAPPSACIFYVLNA
jgi:hypothetical protein